MSGRKTGMALTKSGRQIEYTHGGDWVQSFWHLFQHVQLILVWLTIVHGSINKIVAVWEIIHFVVSAALIGTRFLVVRASCVTEIVEIEVNFVKVVFKIVVKVDGWRSLQTQGMENVDM